MSKTADNKKEAAAVADAKPADAAADAAKSAEESKDEKKKEKKSRKRKEPTPATPVKASEEGKTRSGRATKKVESFTFEATPTRKGIQAMGAGKGKALADIEYIAAAISDQKTDDLQTLHRILYNGAGKVHTRKADIKKFNGFAVGEENKKEHREKLVARIAGYAKDEIKHIAHILSTGGDSKEDMAEKIVDFLYVPKDEGHEYKGKAKRSKSASKTTKKSSKKSSKSDKEKAPRSMTGYMLFGKETRPVIKEKKPELSFGDLTKAVAAKWGKLDDDEKAKWNAKAKKLGPVEKKTKAKSGDKKKASKKSKKEDAGSGTESEEEEEEEQEEKKKPKKKAGKKAKKEEEEEEEEENDAEAKESPKKKQKTEALEKDITEKLDKVIKDTDVSKATVNTLLEKLEKEGVSKDTISDKKKALKSYITAAMKKLVK